MSINVTVRDGEAVRVIIGEQTASAALQADRATLAANAAAAAARYFPSQAAGESGSATGQFFAHPDGAGGLSFREKTGGGSIVIAAAATRAQLDALELVTDKVDPIVDGSTGQVLGPAGNASAPGLTFANDKDTGFFRSASNVLGMAFGGVQKVWWSTTGLSIGDVGTNSRLTVLTGPADALDGINIYNKSGQGTSTAYVSFRGHHYNDANMCEWDLVGGGIAHQITFARNPFARADKPSTFVGGGLALRIRSTTPTGTGGGDGAGSNVMFDIGRQAQFVWYGAGDNTDWNGQFSSARLQMRPANAATRGLYMGYDVAGTRAVIGAINDGVAFEFLDIAASAWRPVSDNFTKIGAASLRVNEIHCANSTINTSDEREKRWRGPATEAELRAARRIIDELGFYQWLAAIDGEGDGLTASEGKGDEARFHFGVRAQQVWAIMADEALVDPITGDGTEQRPGKTPYAFLCFDEWEAENRPLMETVEIEREVVYEAPVSKLRRFATGKKLKTVREIAMVPEERQVTDKAGSPVFEVVRPAGNRFGIRTEQLALFLVAAQDARIAALEAAR